MELNLFISNGTVSIKNYDKRGDISRSLMAMSLGVPHEVYGVYISQLIRFARASSHVSDFSCRNKALTTAKLLKQEYHYHKLRNAFSKFYRRHSELVEQIMSA